MGGSVVTAQDFVRMEFSNKLLIAQCSAHSKHSANIHPLKNVLSYLAPQDNFSQSSRCNILPPVESLGTWMIITIFPLYCFNKLQVI